MSPSGKSASALTYTDGAGGGVASPCASGHKPRSSDGGNAFVTVAGESFERVCALACYGNGWFAGAQTPEGYAAKARSAVQLGFKALKWDPFGHAYLDMDRAQRNQTIAIVEAVRDAVGPDIDLMIEVQGRPNVPTAIAMARELERFAPRWFEEPLPPESIDALAEVRARSPIPIATGERYFEPERFLELISKRAVDVLQPDVGHVGGMLEAKKIAGLAHMRYLPVAPHNPTGPVMNAMTIHLAASIPNFHILETIAVDVPWRKEIVREDLQFTAGEIRPDQARPWR